MTRTTSSVTIIQPHQFITSLEGVPGRLDKEAILNQAILHSKDFLKGAKLALNSTITFGVKQVPFKEKGITECALSFEEFELALEQLASREVTGHDARDLIISLMHTSSTDSWNNWYRRILIKDLRCGVDIKTVNKVLKSLGKTLIPVFECQLAHDSSKHENKMVGKKLLSVKLDGTRVLAVVHKEGGVDLFSRTGKELHNFEEIVVQLKNNISPLLKESTVFDGELMSSSFQDLMKQLRRKEDVNTTDATLYLFDMLPLSHFRTGTYSIPQSERSIRLEVFIESIKGKANHTLNNVTCLSQVSVNLDTEEGKEVFRNMNREAISQGYEGLMLKDPSAPYECKRTTSWLKLKPFLEVSLTISAFEEGTGKYEGKLGAILCKGFEEGKTIEVSVGGGFTDEQREEFWEHKESLPGKVVEIRADTITKNQDAKNTTYSLRFPRFLRFRGFEIGEKL